MIKWLFAWILEQLPFEVLIAPGVFFGPPFVVGLAVCGISEGGCPRGYEVKLVIGMIAVWALTAWLFRKLPRPRLFAWGMAGSLLIALLFPFGRGIALLWTLPVTGPVEFARQAITRAGRGSPEDRQRTEWLAARRGRPLLRAAGIRLANEADRCIIRIRRRSGAPVVAGSALRETACWLWMWEDGRDDPALSNVGRYGDDSGWRWSAQESADAYRIVVAPDPALLVKGPVFELDRSGVVRERAVRDAPARIAFDAAATLRELYRCVQRSGAVTRAGWTFEAVRSACATLHVQPRDQTFRAHPYEATLHVYAHDSLFIEATRVALLPLELRPLAGGAFELRAGLQVDGQVAPHRRYVVDAAGVVREAEP